MKTILKATQYENGRIAIYAEYGEAAEVNSGGRCSQLYDTDTETISKTAKHLQVTELDILMAIDNVGQTIRIK